MKRFILEINLKDPYECTGCLCMNEIYNDYYCEAMDHSNNDGLLDEYPSRPDWCPLREAKEENK